MGAKTGIEWTDSTWSPLCVRVKDDAAEIARQKGYTSLVQIAEKMAGHFGQHCEHVSEGCRHCYSGTFQHRCLPKSGTGLPFERRSRDLVDVIVDERVLLLPLKWQPIQEHELSCTAAMEENGNKRCSCYKKHFRPRRIFVENQSDLFGEWNDDMDIARVVAMILICRWHVLQVLTKRIERARALFSSLEFREMVDCFANEVVMENTDPDNRKSDDIRATTVEASDDANWPLPNLWLGVSVEDPESADARIPELLQTPAAKRFVSYEPALAAVDFGFGRWVRLPRAVRSDLPFDPLLAGPGTYRAVSNPHGALSVVVGGKLLGIKPGEFERLPILDWGIIGGESGPGARPFDVAYARSAINQFRAAGRAVFMKQAGTFVVDSNDAGFDGDSGEWPTGTAWEALDNYGQGAPVRVKLKHPKGGDISKWPVDMRVREFPC